MSNGQNIEQDVRELSASEIDAVSGAGIFTHSGGTRGNPMSLVPPHNPWLEPCSPERRFG